MYRPPENLLNAPDDIRYMFGQCHALALLVNQLTGLPLGGWTPTNELLFGEPCVSAPCHIVCYNQEEGYYVDVNGKHSLWEPFYDEYGNECEFAPITREELGLLTTVGTETGFYYKSVLDSHTWNLARELTRRFFLPIRGGK